MYAIRLSRLIRLSLIHDIISFIVLIVSDLFPNDIALTNFFSKEKVNENCMPLFSLKSCRHLIEKNTGVKVEILQAPSDYNQYAAKVTAITDP